MRDPQDISPLSRDWLKEEQDAAGKMRQPVPPPPPAQAGSAGDNSHVPGIDPFAWWASSAVRTRYPGKTKKNSAAAQAKRARERRQVTALLVAGGVVTLGLAGIGGAGAMYLLQKRRQESIVAPPTATAAPGTGLQTSAHNTPTPTPEATQAPTATPSPSPTPGHTGTVIGSTSQPINTGEAFANPLNGRNSVLIHLPDGRFVAYDKACTHEGETVFYNTSTHQLYCPAHGALFDPANNGAVIRGPSNGPLKQVPIHVNADGTITVG
ncbi:MAG: Rieske 2Fe-2S domain-containing protein [Ktedonobacteraceae bacterium]|nr:Rieske 2Fe-2S domain-containing protein [Ktedonobacteraceae bacterium]